jgi:glycosyltransferase involved in cell wall biosynthesis
MHIITSLDAGGAEAMLAQLLTRFNCDHNETFVVSLKGEGIYGDNIREIGAHVASISFSRSFPDPRSLLKLMSLVRRYKPDIVQTWMYHADLIGGLTAFILGRIPLAWSIHHSMPNREYDKKSTLLIARMCAILSKIVPVQIVCSSNAAKKGHEKFGYDNSKMTVITNGVDTSKFKPDLDARARLRKLACLGRDDFVVGFPARFHPIKGHQMFLQAASTVAKCNANIKYILCGDGVAPINMELQSIISNLGLEDRVVMLGVFDDMKSFFAGIDAMAITSHSESFPLTLIEAMSCGVPCVTTDVGDCAEIVGETGFVTAVGDSEATAKAIIRIMNMDIVNRNTLGMAARRRVENNYAIDITVDKYRALYKKMIESKTSL